MPKDTGGATCFPLLWERATHSQCSYRPWVFCKSVSLVFRFHFFYLSHTHQETGGSFETSTEGRDGEVSTSPLSRFAFAQVTKPDENV